MKYEVTEAVGKPKSRQNVNIVIASEKNKVLKQETLLKTYVTLRCTYDFYIAICLECYA